MSIQRDVLLFHISEANEQLESLIRELNENPEQDEESLFSQVAHAYHHLNSGWNARFRERYFENQTDELFFLERRMPEDIGTYLTDRYNPGS